MKFAVLARGLCAWVHEMCMCTDKAQILISDQCLHVPYFLVAWATLWIENSLTYYGLTYGHIAKSAKPWFMIFDTWYMIYATWYMTYDIWFMIDDIWYTIYDIGHWDDILYTIYDIWYMINDIQNII